MSTTDILTEEDVPGAKLDTTKLHACSNVQLKRWLQCRALPVGGNKEALIKRILDCVHNEGANKISISVDKGIWAQKKRESRHGDSPTAGPSSEGCSTSTARKWATFPSQSLPKLFCYGTIYAHMVGDNDNKSSDDSRESSDETTHNWQSGLPGHSKPLSRGRISFSSGHVLNMEDSKCNDTIYVRSKVLPSFNIGKPYAVCVGLSLTTGNISFADCNCKASLSKRCSHICALLFAVEDYTLQFGLEPTACTSKLQTWNQGRKRKNNPMKVTDAEYQEKQPRKSDTLLMFDPRPSSMKTDMLSTQDKANFLRDLQSSGSTTMWESILFYDYPEYVITLERKQELDELTKAAILNLTPKQSLQEIVLTQGTEEWQRERRLRITASETKDFVTSKPSSLERLIKEKLWSTRDISDLPAIRHGKTHENDAYVAYEMLLPPNQCVVKAGFYVNENYPFLGCSPDGIVKDSDKTVGVLEIKCPLTLHKNKLVPIKLGELPPKLQKNQCFTVDGGVLKLRRNNRYYFQVQMQMLTMDVKWCDFVVWSYNEIDIERIGIDEVFAKSIAKKLKSVHKEYLLREYFEMRIPRRLPLEPVEEIDISIMIVVNEEEV